MTMQTWIGLATFVIVALVHTAALFHWGGRVTTTLEFLRKDIEEHNKRIARLEREAP